MITVLIQEGQILSSLEDNKTKKRKKNAARNDWLHKIVFFVQQKINPSNLTFDISVLTVSKTGLSKLSNVYDWQRKWFVKHDICEGQAAE